MIEVLVGAAVEAVAPADREWAVQRPSRGAHAGAVRQASEVPSRWRRFHDCVAERESHNNPNARNPHSSAQGTYQFLDRLWRSSLAGQTAARLREYGVPRMAAADVRQYLQRREIATWPAVYQRVGFVEVLTRGGSYHWRLPGSRCEAFR